MSAFAGKQTLGTIISNVRFILEAAILNQGGSGRSRPKAVMHGFSANILEILQSFKFITNYYEHLISGKDI